jgi:O-antigen/teichoic acid export membrane protein
MALGAVAGVLANVVVLNFLRPGEIFMRPTLRGVRDVISFGSVSSFVSVMRELSFSAPDLILGRTLGFADVAFYSRANGFRQMALVNMLRWVRGVYFPAFAAEIRAGGNAAGLYVGSMLYVVSITASVLAILAVLAQPLILVLFGEQWVRSGQLATLLCLFGVLTTSTSFAAMALIADGKINIVMRAEIAIAVTRIGTLLSSIWLPLEQVVLVYGLTFVVEQIAYQRALQHGFGLTALALWRGLARSYLLLPFAIAGPMLVVVGRQLLGPQLPSLIIVVVGLFLGLLGWIVGALVLRHPIWLEIERAFAYFSDRMRKLLR